MNREILELNQGPGDPIMLTELKGFFKGADLETCWFCNIAMCFFKGSFLLIFQSNSCFHLPGAIKMRKTSSRLVKHDLKHVLKMTK